MSLQTWEQCLNYLQDELPPQQFNTWIRPLKVDESAQGLKLLAPNRFVADWVNDKFLARITELYTDISGQAGIDVRVEVSQRKPEFKHLSTMRSKRSSPPPAATLAQQQPRARSFYSSEPPPVSANNISQLSGQQIIEQPSLIEGDSNNAPPTHSAHENVNLGSESLHRDPPAEKREAFESPVLSGRLIDSPAPNESRPSMGASDQVRKSIQMRKPEPRQRNVQVEGGIQHQSTLTKHFTFDTFVEGKSNQLARAAAAQVAENPGGAYNPLFLYGGVGLGKTHLMQAVGNALAAKNVGAKIVYLHSERFVADMVKALQLNAINEFKRYYRSVDALLIDDIQFFAGKERSQEEFFHTFNALLEGNQQMILTSDRYPKEIKGLEERLKSRFGWGLTVAVEPPELETRVAILKKKADQAKVHLPNDAAFFIAQRIRSNVRELEGALKRVMANSHFTGNSITTSFIKESLKDLLALQDKQVSIENIQRTTAEYYKIKVADLLSKRRSRSVARPRQVAMCLAKELTSHSLPEIGDAFGGRDHTTVLHACRKVKELRELSSDINEDYNNLLRLLTT